MQIIAPPNIKEFLEKRIKPSTDRINNIVFEVKDEDPRSISFSPDFNSLVISAAGIGDLDNYFNKVGLLQAFYRFIGFHVAPLGTFLLHCSSGLYKDGAVIFGDHGKAGKTLSSVELGLFTHEYLADEFVFWNSISGEIFSDEDIPVHLRGEVREHLKERHQIEDAMEFTPSNLLKFNWHERASLSLICFTTFTEEKERVVILTNSQAIDYARTTLAAHTQKMLNPALDRFQFIAMRDNTSQSTKTEVSKSLVHTARYQKMVPIFNQAAELLVSQAPSIEIFTSDPCHIPELIQSIL